MAETLFQFNQHDFEAQSNAYSDVIAKEFYSGTFTFDEDRPSSRLILRKGASFPVPIFSVESNLDSALRRRPEDTRSRSTDVYAVWLLLNGNLKIITARNTSLFREGQVVITWPGEPGVIHGMVNNSRRRHHIIALIPTAFFHRPFAEHRDLSGFSFPMDVGDGRVVSSIIELLHAEGDRLPSSSASTLFQEALQAIERLCSASLTVEKRQTITERRMQEIDSFVERHLSDAGMSAAQVATACKISRRYLYRLLDARQTTFSEMLWAKRREQARRWLCAPQMRQCSIGEIAVRAGFRSLSHFSESFKRHYGSTPSAYRKATSDAAAIVEGAGA